MTLTIDLTATEKDNFTIDWVTRGLAAGDSIASQSFVPSSTDFTISNTSIVASPSTGAAASGSLFWVNGGIPGTFYDITVTATTVSGRILNETVTYEVTNQRVN